ncbi:MAG: DUF763 domain-containing protein [Gemmatimonadota bacterium]|nr:MAG: DUF763 domain-containing protein [Gemmatimonadota bacterium]
MTRRTGTATLPLHTGRAPRWLFQRMSAMARALTQAYVIEHGPAAFLQRLSDPYWFQALGCVLGFDWHSSGVTTTVCGALKTGLAGTEADTSVFVAGGKGRASRRTPAELESYADRLGLDGARLIYASRMSAKVDSAALQDGYQIYHHAFFFTPTGEWAVVQQGMHEEARSARRYHWLGSRVADFVCEPHSAICSQRREQLVLDLVADEAAGARSAAAAVARAHPAAVQRELADILRLDLPRRHHVDVRRDVSPRNLHSVLLSTYEAQPIDFEALLALRGVGAKVVRALALIAELTHGEPASFRDPARFSFAHGGKDGHPYPVDRDTYDRSIAWLREAVSQARIDHSERLSALRRLARWEHV